MTNKIVLLLAAVGVVIAGSCNQVITVRPPAQFSTGNLTDADIQGVTNPDDSSGEPYRVAIETEAEIQTRKLRSLGKATAPGAKTYYIDAQDGNDMNIGTHPLKAWKSFKNVNHREFRPGDHILLEADSIWNGESVDIDNYKTLIKSDTVGMLWLKSSGTEDAPIVIDLYDKVYPDEGDEDQRPMIYWSATQRPIINGNGTPPVDPNAPYGITSPILLEGTDYVTLRNIEVTNTFEDPTVNPNHWQNYRVIKPLLGIEAKNGSKPFITGITVQNCYVHDVQSEHSNNSSSPLYLSSYFGGSHTARKIVGGMAVYNVYKSLIEGNIIKKVGLEGLRAGGYRPGAPATDNSKPDQVVVRGNYVESVAGDGIVLSSVGSIGTPELGGYSGLIESNIVKDACAAVLGGANYAACWVYYGHNSLFQYNEAYGTIYGNNDGEAWDIDNSSNKVVYQYNYSHHNAGGAILFMSAISHGVFRYNISANDGAGTRYLATVTDPNSEFTISTSANSFAAWKNGQCIFHYTSETTTANTNVPLIYNNTFYVGKGITCGLFGHNTTKAVEKYVRFINNVVVKAGDGTLYLSYGQQGDGKVAGKIKNESGFTNNLLWGYDTDPTVGDFFKFNNGSGTVPETLFTMNSNVWENPKLRIQEADGEDVLRAQRNDAFPMISFTDPEALKDFTSKDRLRSRAALFAPTNGSNLAARGRDLKEGTGSFDGAWNAPAVTEDIFGTPFITPPLGAAAVAP